MSERLNYECYIVTPGESIDLSNSESVVARHQHPGDSHALVVWTERKQLLEAPLGNFEDADDSDGDE